MRMAFRVVLALTLLPPLLGVAGMLLSWAAGCSGMSHIEHCEIAWLFPYVAPLIAFVWVSVFVVPVGVAVLALLGLLLWWRRRGARPRA